MEIHEPTAYGDGWYVLIRGDLDPQRYQVIRTSDGTLRELIDSALDDIEMLRGFGLGTGEVQAVGRTLEGDLTQGLRRAARRVTRTCSTGYAAAPARRATSPRGCDEPLPG